MKYKFYTDQNGYFKAVVDKQYRGLADHGGSFKSLITKITTTKLKYKYKDTVENLTLLFESELSVAEQNYPEWFI